MTPCREYRGARNNHGYGVRRHGGRNVLVHRWVMSQVVGWEALAGKVVMHTCDNPSCFRLDHLVIGTRRENTQDMLAKGRGLTKHGPPRPKRRMLTEAEKADILRSADKESNRAIARRLGISHTGVAYVLQTKAGRNGAR